MNRPHQHLHDLVIGGPNCSGCNPMRELPTAYDFAGSIPIDLNPPRDKPSPAWHPRLLGKRVDVYLNRHVQCLSVRHKGRVRLYTQRALLQDVKFVVQPAGNLKARAGQRTVHAWCKGTYVEMDEGEGLLSMPVDPREIVYNPRLHETFVYRDTGTPVFEAAYVVVQWDSPHVLAWCW